eukprot:3661090-Pyramimonas_sp.AAC.1
MPAPLARLVPSRDWRPDAPSPDAMCDVRGADQRSGDAGIVGSAARLPRQLFGQEPSVVSPAEASQPARASRDFL